MKKGIMIGFLSGLFSGVAAMLAWKGTQQRQVNDFDKVKKFKAYYNMLNQWLMLRNEGKGLSGYFSSRGYRTIAVYGMGEMGERFCEELEGSDDVDILFGIDRSADLVLPGRRIYSPEEQWEPVDAIVVTSVFAFDGIKESLKGKVSCPVISLDDVIQELL